MRVFIFERVSILLNINAFYRCLIIFVAVVAVPDIARSDDSASEISSLESTTWCVVEFKRNGRAYSSERQETRYSFCKDTFILSKDNDEVRLKYKLDKCAMPTAIDVGEIGTTNYNVLGIYTLEKNKLLICFGRIDGPRPSSFATKKGDGQALVVLIRHDG